jgi:hypothetical protein
MTAFLQAGFKNNINAVTIRQSARTVVYTDRALDIDGNGTKEIAARSVTDGSNAESRNTQTGDTYYTLSNS